LSRLIIRKKPPRILYAAVFSYGLSSAYMFPVFFLSLCFIPMLCPLVEAFGVLFGLVVSILLISADDAGFGLPPVADAPGALFGSEVSILLISAAEGRFTGLPPVADAPGALFGSAVFMFWATDAVANKPMVAAARKGIIRMFDSP